MIDMLAANGGKKEKNGSRSLSFIFFFLGKVTNVRRVTYVVVDEADRMFDMGFVSEFVLLKETNIENGNFLRNYKSVRSQITYVQIDNVYYSVQHLRKKSRN